MNSDGFGASVLSDVLSNALCIGIPLIAVFVAYYLRGRRRLRGFFGISDRRDATVQIRLSNMFVKPAGTLSPLSIGHGFIGPAINATEYQYALELTSAVQSRPFAGAAYALVEQFGVKAVDRPVVCRISPSLDFVRVSHLEIDRHEPVDFERDQGMVNDIRRMLAMHTSFVLVGSPVYNVLSYYVLSNCGDQMRIRFVEAESEPGHSASAVEILGFHPSGASQVFERRLLEVGDGTVTYEEYFVLQKVTRWNGSPTTIFICAGTSTASTAAALVKLSNWRALADEFGRGPFAMVYAVRTADREMPATSDERQSPWTVARIWPPES